jgi:hypothetical protein
MKKIALLIISIAAYVSITFAAAAGTTTAFQPSRANVGGFGWDAAWGSPESYFWVFSSDGREFNLGLTTDAKAKAMYATILAAIANGQAIEIGYYTDPPTDATTTGSRKIWTTPNYVSLLK